MSASPGDADPVLRLLGVFAGRPSPLPGDGRPSAIFKTPIEAAQRLGPTGLSDDSQADRKVHGGPERALCHYPAEHYPYWAAAYPAQAQLFVPGAFGENLASHGLIEAKVAIGDVFRLGKALIQVGQPRFPCWKLGHRFEQEELPRAIAETGRSGWLYRVLEPGAVGPDAALERVEHHPAGVTVAAVWALFDQTRPDRQWLEQVAELDVLAQPWRKKFRSRLAWLRKQGS